MEDSSQTDSAKVKVLFMKQCLLMLHPAVKFNDQLVHKMFCLLGSNLNVPVNNFSVI